MMSDDDIRLRYRLPIAALVCAAVAGTVIGMMALLATVGSRVTESTVHEVPGRLWALNQMPPAICVIGFIVGAAGFLNLIDRLRRMGMIRISETRITLPTDVVRGFVSIAYNDIHRIQFFGEEKKLDACTVFFSRGTAHVERSGFETPADFMVLQRALEQHVKRANFLYPSARHWSD